jgi:hypothetical protein
LGGRHFYIYGCDFCLDRLHFKKKGLDFEMEHRGFQSPTAPARPPSCRTFHEVY